MLCIILIMLTLSTVGASLQAGEVRDLVTELDLASCRLVIMEPRITEVTRAWTEARSSLCTQLPCYSSTLESKLHFPSGVTLVLLVKKCSHVTRSAQCWGNNLCRHRLEVSPRLGPRVCPQPLSGHEEVRSELTIR